MEEVEGECTDGEGRERGEGNTIKKEEGEEKKKTKVTRRTSE